MPSRTNSSLTASLLPEDERRESMIGAEINLPDETPILDLDKLTEEDKQTLRQALFDNSVVVIRNQQGINPQTLPKLAAVFDPHATNEHSAGKKAVSDPRNILSSYRAGRLPAAPQVSVIGSGKFTDYEGISELEVVHLDHTLFHELPLSPEELDKNYTRPYRWHMDTPLYERLPGEVTILHGVQIPKVPDQKIKFENGEEKTIAAGSTAFFSGARVFNLLTPEEKEFAMNTTVTYAPQAYEYIRNCKCSADGLTIPTFGKETPLEELSEWTQEHVAEYPMVWKNPGNGQPHFQVHGCCVYKLTTKNPATGEVTVVDDVPTVRKIVYAMQRKVYAAENIYAHRWREGDVVIFHNKGVMHSITGQLAKYKEEEEKKRLMWQCTMSTTQKPIPYRA
ncbi:Alpha-ketoglutarate dependent xanthine dioxygenase [Neofusicoccum parvum]|nr:Alpha-ketoglutarate dependent xanthine dioxygenase [Neofusicoccum parvum]